MTGAKYHSSRPVMSSVNHGRNANNESSEVCGINKPGRRVKLNRSQAVNVNKLLTIRYLWTEVGISVPILKELDILVNVVH